MRRNIFMYLFLFAALWIVFQYVNNTKVYESQQKTITKLEERLTKKDSLYNAMTERLALSEGFTLAGNVNAQEYFEKSNASIPEIIQQVSDAVYEKNVAPSGNDLISYKGDTRPYAVNSIQVINHRWLIADFSDGNTWGEILVRYFINEDGSIDFEVADELLYPSA